MEVLDYIEVSINNAFIGLKRFNVLGYGKYWMKSKDIEDFISIIRDLKSEKVKDKGIYDKKFDTVVIQGEDFDKA